MLSDEHLRELGRLGVNAAALENIIAVVASELIDDDPAVGRAVLGSLGFAQIADRILALLPHRHLTAGSRTWIQDGVSAAKRAMIRRNQLLHSHWIADGGGEPALQLRRAKSGPDYAMEVEVEDIEDVSKALDNACSNLRIGWVRLVMDLGRTEADPDASRPGMRTAPNRWQFPDPVVPSPSRSKTAQDRWVEGRITWDEYEATREAD